MHFWFTHIIHTQRSQSTLDTPVLQWKYAENTLQTDKISYPQKFLSTGPFKQRRPYKQVLFNWTRFGHTCANAFSPRPSCAWRQPLPYSAFCTDNASVLGKYLPFLYACSYRQKQTSSQVEGKKQGIINLIMCSAPERFAKHERKSQLTYLIQTFFFCDRCSFPEVCETHGSQARLGLKLLHLTRVKAPNFLILFVELHHAAAEVVKGLICLSLSRKRSACIHTAAKSSTTTINI